QHRQHDVQSFAGLQIPCAWDHRLWTSAKSRSCSRPRDFRKSEGSQGKMDLLSRRQPSQRYEYGRGLRRELEYWDSNPARQLPPILSWQAEGLQLGHD